MMNEMQKEIYFKLRHMGPALLPDANIMVHNGDVRPNIPQQIFGRYNLIEKAEDETQKAKLTEKVKAFIMNDFDENTSAWIPLERFLVSLDAEQLEKLRQELETE